MDKLGLSVVMAGFLISAFSMCTSFSQPVFGWIGDRVGYAYFVCLSPLATGIAIGSVGLCSSFAGMVAALSIAGLSIAAFHPAAFAYTASYPLCARPKALSHLLLYGSFGFVGGPLAASAFTDYAGLDAIWLFVVPGALMTGLLLRKTCSLSSARGKTVAESGLRSNSSIASILPLFSLASCITIITMSLYTFTPILLSAQGCSLVVVGAMISAFAFGCALGPFSGVWLAKKSSELKAVIASAVLSIVLLLCFIHTDAMVPKGILFFFLGLSLMLPYAIFMHLGQKRIPERPGLASSLLGGGAWGLGGLALIGVGKAAEAFGTENVLELLIILVIFTMPVIFWCEHRGIFTEQRSKATEVN